MRSSKQSTFHAIAARSWSRFKANDSNRTNIAYMGIDCSTDARGDYYLQTNSDPPYSRGINSIRYLN